ncbi:hypothetical protein Ddc_16579 [Ditylenchus destructor]|nr:hypothetical protein Ddc_16579 [Ditylenchus destructor]
MVNETTTLATPEATTSTPALLAIWKSLSDEIIPRICWFLTVLLISILLLCYRYLPYFLKLAKSGLSLPMTFLLGNHLLNAAVFIFSVYVVNPLFITLNIGAWLDPWWSFWVGNYLLSAPAMVFFVVMDRYLALVLSFKYTENVRRTLKLTEHEHTLIVFGLYLNVNVYMSLTAYLDAAICSLAYTRLLFNFKHIKRMLGPAGALQASTAQVTVTAGGR